MKDKAVKILNAIALALLFLLVPRAYLVSFFIDDEKSFFVWLVFGYFGVPLVLLMLIIALGGLKIKPVPAEIKPFIYSSFNEYINFMEKALEQKGYKKQKKAYLGERCEITMYIKRRVFLKLDCYIDIRSSEMSEDVAQEVKNAVSEIVSEYCHGTMIFKSINCISVICVNHITSDFQKLVNGNIIQEMKIGRLPIGIALDEKNIYVAKQKDGLFIAKYKHLRKEYLKLLKLCGYNENSV